MLYWKFMRLLMYVCVLFYSYFRTISKSILWIQKKLCWLAPDCRSSCHVFYRISVFFCSFSFSALKISTYKLLLLSETWQSSKLRYSGSTFLWMHALNSLDSRHPFQELATDICLLYQGGRQDVLMQLFLSCLLWTVLSALDVYKCSLKTARTLDLLNFGFILVLENMCNSSQLQDRRSSSSQSFHAAFINPDSVKFLSTKRYYSFIKPHLFCVLFSSFPSHIDEWCLVLYFSTCKLFTGAVCRY